MPTSSFLFKLRQPEPLMFSIATLQYGCPSKLLCRNDIVNFIVNKNNVFIDTCCVLHKLKCPRIRFLNETQLADSIDSGKVFGYSQLTENSPGIFPVIIGQQHLFTGKRR